MDEKKAIPAKPIKVTKMSKAMFIKQKGISHLNSKERQKEYDKYLK
jgi:hypothetical protein